MAVHLTEPVSLSLGALDTWHTIDIGAAASLPAEATFVILVSTASSSADAIRQVRPVGWTEIGPSLNLSASSSGRAMFIAPKVAEFYYSNTNTGFEVIGYGSEITWLESAAVFNGGNNSNDYRTVDISSAVPANAKYALLTPIATGSFGVGFDGKKVGTAFSASSNYRTNNGHYKIVELNANREVSVKDGTTVAVIDPAFVVAGWIAEGGYKYYDTPDTDSNSTGDWKQWPTVDPDLVFAALGSTNASTSFQVREVNGTGFSSMQARWCDFYVPTNGGAFEYYQNSAYTMYLRGGFVDTAASTAPTISSVTPSTVSAGSNPVIAGTNFGATKGGGSVIISPTDDSSDVNAVTQTIGAWADDEITLSGVSFPSGTAHEDALFVFVTNDSAETNAAGGLVVAYIAPLLTNPTQVNVGSTTVTPRVTTTVGNGTAYHVIFPQSDPDPTKEQIAAGNGADDQPAAFSGSMAVDTAGVLTFPEVTGLDPATAYRIGYTHNGDPNA